MIHHTLSTQSPTPTGIKPIGPPVRRSRLQQRHTDLAVPLADTVIPLGSETCQVQEALLVPSDQQLGLLHDLKVIKRTVENLIKLRIALVLKESYDEF